jgi:hypothetical protein
LGFIGNEGVEEVLEVRVAVAVEVLEGLDLVGVLGMGLGIDRGDFGEIPSDLDPSSVLKRRQSCGINPSSS